MYQCVEHWSAHIDPVCVCVCVLSGIVNCQSEKLFDVNNSLWRLSYHMMKDFILMKAVCVCLCMCVYVCVCEREREREIGRGSSQWVPGRSLDRKSVV